MILVNTCHVPLIAVSRDMRRRRLDSHLARSYCSVFRLGDARVDGPRAGAWLMPPAEEVWEPGGARFGGLRWRVAQSFGSAMLALITPAGTWPVPLIASMALALVRGSCRWSQRRVTRAAAQLASRCSCGSVLLPGCSVLRLSGACFDGSRWHVAYATDRSIA